MIFSKRPVAIASAAVVLGIAVAAWVYTKQWRLHSSPEQQNAYVNAAVCTGCHADLAAGFRKTGMGRSFARLRPDHVPAFGKPFHHKASDSYFAMLARDGRYYQRRWQIGFDGKETNVEEKQVDFVIGSGHHSFTYLHLASHGALQVLPLSWYSEKGGYWDMSPGYDQPDFPGSIRPVHYECMFCHNAYPKIPEALEHAANAEMTFLDPLPEGIDCQRCHGPGQRHVALASAGVAREQIRAAIVNPKRLAPERELEVCFECHLETTSQDLPHSIRRFDKAPFSYVPGQPLGDFRVEFDQRGGMKDRFEIAGGAYRLRQSQCYIQSAGKLRCTTCHNPHDIPHGPGAAAHYNAVCEQCHAALLQRPAALLARTAGGPHAAGADCIACHMPKRRTDDVVHVVMTDHFIQRQEPAGDFLAPKAETVETAANRYSGEVVPYYPAPLADTPENALYTAAAQVRNRRNLTEGLPRLENLLERYHPAAAGFYAELALGYGAAADWAKAIPYFEEAARQEPTAFRLTQLGNALMENRQFPQAEAALRRAIGLAPGEPMEWGTLGWVLWQQDKGAEARADLERAVALDPELPELHNNLANVEWGTGDQAAAEQQFREALRIEPGVAEWRLNLARVLATRGEIPEARFQFEQAIRLKPDSAEARLDYGRLLADHRELAAAIRQLETAVRLQADLWRAHFELAMALGQSGNAGAAREQLTIAAHGSDAEVRAQALDVLQKLGR
jgi:tetratricopeptide (TPR) repeat protein